MKENKTKEIICKNPKCGKKETISLYSNLKYCNECKDNFKEKKIIQCYYCKEDVIVGYNVKEVVCKQCKKEGKKSPKGSKLKETSCYICNNKILVSIISSNIYSVCKDCKNKGFKNPQASLNGSKSINVLKNRTESEKLQTNIKIKKSLKELYKNENKKEEIVNKRKSTYLKNTNGKYKHQMENPEIVKKIMKKNYIKRDSSIIKRKLTNKKIRNCEHSLQDPLVRKKSRETCISKYGVDHWTKTKQGKLFLRTIGLEKHYPYREKILEKLGIELVDNEYIHSHYNHTWLCKKCNNKFQTIWNNIQQGFLCPICYPRNSGESIAESEIFNFLKEILPNEMLIIKNTKIVISPYELDIYIPDKNIAIEHDGLFWHKNYDRNYHLNKTEMCNKLNITLIHIFEDEWIYKKDIVKSRLKHILNVSNNQKIHGRKCIIKEIDSIMKDNFLNQFHIQGKDISRIRLGAFYNDELVSVMTFSYGNISKGSKKENGVWELNRFCSSDKYRVIGIAGKLLEYFKRNYEWEKIFSYADIRWSNGNLYNRLGFKLDYTIKPNYWYIKGYKRIHRFNLRKNSEEKKYDISEKLLRLSEGYNTIWDCGNYKFYMKK